MKIELNKRDSFLFAFVIVLVSVGFVYAFTTDGSGNPAIMGHSGGELNVTHTACNDSQYLRGDGACKTAFEIVSEAGVVGGGDLDLYLGLHSSVQCENLDGTVATIDGKKICWLPDASCGSWTQLDSWSSTKTETFMYIPCTICILTDEFGECKVPPTTFHGQCSVYGHTQEDKVAETCNTGIVGCQQSDLRVASVVEVGCY